MKSILAVFNNRNQAIQFANYLGRYNVRCKTVSTPRDLTSSCGLSVVFAENYLAQARFVLGNFRMSAFVGFYVIVNDAYKKYIRLL